MFCLLRLIDQGRFGDNKYSNQKEINEPNLPVVAVRRRRRLLFESRECRQCQQSLATMTKINTQKGEKDKMRRKKTER